MSVGRVTSSTSARSPGSRVTKRSPPSRPASVVDHSWTLWKGLNWQEVTPSLRGDAGGVPPAAAVSTEPHFTATVAWGTTTRDPITWDARTRTTVGGARATIAPRRNDATRVGSLRRLYDQPRTTWTSERNTGVLVAPFSGTCGSVWEVEGRRRRSCGRGSVTSWSGRPRRRRPGLLLTGGLRRSVHRDSLTTSRRAGGYPFWARPPSPHPGPRSRSVKRPPVVPATSLTSLIPFGALKPLYWLMRKRGGVGKRGKGSEQGLLDVDTTVSRSQK